MKHFNLSQGRFLRLIQLIGCIILIFVFTHCKKEISSKELSASTILYLNGGDNDRVQKIQPTKDGGFIFCGYTITGNSNTQGFLLKVDGNGKQEWYKTYGDDNFDLFNAAIECSDGGFVAVGRTNMTGAGAFTDMDYVVKTDAKGNMLWSKSFTDGQLALNELRDVTEGDDHFIYATGNYPSTSVFMAVFVLKFDLQGNMVFSKGIEGLKTYKPYKFDDLHPVVWAGGMNITSSPAGNLIIGADLNIYSDPAESVPGLLSLTQNGEVNFYYPYFGRTRPLGFQPANNSPITKVVSVIDGYYLCWSHDSTDGSGVRQCVSLLKTDLEGNPLWQKNYTGIGNAIILNMQIDAKGSLFIVGCTSSKPATNLFPETFQNAKSWVLKVDNNGSILSEKYTGSESNVNILKGIQVKQEGGLLAAGYTSINSLGFHKMYVIHLNSI